MKYLKFFLKTFQKFVFGTFQKYSRILRYFSKVFWNIMTYLVDCSVFKMFRNFHFIPKYSDLFWKHFENILKNFQDCSEAFRFVFRIFQKCSGTLRRFLWTFCRKMVANLIQVGGGPFSKNVFHFVSWSQK